MIIAVDGPSGAGKSTVCRAVAHELGLFLLDTGAIYRTVTWSAMNNDIDLSDGETLGKHAATLDIHFLDSAEDTRVHCNGQDVTEAIRTSAVTANVSQVAAQPPVREALLEQQRTIGHRAEHAVVEGRDIGTVVFPNADLKVYYTASAEARAQRRLLELLEKGESVDFAEVLASIEARDEYDRNREIAPLRKPDDAVVLDTSDLTFEQAQDALKALISEALN